MTMTGFVLAVAFLFGCPYIIYKCFIEKNLMIRINSISF